MLDAVPIPADDRRTIILELGNRRVISAGWSLNGEFTSEVFATENFPFSTTSWRIVIWNDTDQARTIVPYLISKRP